MARKALNEALNEARTYEQGWADGRDDLLGQLMAHRALLNEILNHTHATARLPGELAERVRKAAEGGA